MHVASCDKRDFMDVLEVKDPAMGDDLGLPGHCFSHTKMRVCLFSDRLCPVLY